MNGIKLSEIDLAVSGYLDHLIVDRGLARLTVESYGSDMKDFSRFLASKGARNAAHINREDLLRYLAVLDRRGFSARTRARKISCIRSFFRFLMETGQIGENPSDLIAAPRLPKRIPHYLELEEVERLLVATDHATLEGKRDATMLELLYATGLRVTELVEAGPLPRRSGNGVCHRNGEGL